MDPTDTADPRAWIGRTEIAHDRITATPVRALAATLDLEDPTAAAALPLPPLWHWLYFLPLHRQSDIGPDGHARRGGFLPPVPLPRRMWAGSRFEFRAPLRVGDTVTRKSEIEDVRDRMGRSGQLCFVTVRHELRCHGDHEAALVERHDIVYREARRSTDAEPPRQRARADAQWQRTIIPDAVLLFRYSALTFNGHRIHYDRRHATEIEGYPGLVVHGPLIATLLMDLLRRHRADADVADFAFKAVRPAFDDHALTLCGRSDGAQVRLWAHDREGWLVMEASATLRNT
ncbi:MAG: MaoC family dehydratase N-terminal domain-containing protein [Aquincola sp.]|nr:MaoC family dehydratase N-terminal domain-containing protein [Aquincola sp.]MDH4290105.1 MaoC family dehydratase N-terminal domain-containing protein [Aquincola sp.]MDH5329738.1 MaoC family dehydratase N-terminal domain-containing protein [Aquincola sp.]